VCAAISNLTPYGLRVMLDLAAVYLQTAAYGHFGARTGLHLGAHRSRRSPGGGGPQMARRADHKTAAPEL